MNDKKATRIVLYYLLRNMHSGYVPKDCERALLDRAIEKLKIDSILL